MTATQSDPMSFEKSYRLPAARETVFAALTDAGALRCWFAECVEVSPQVGGAYRFWGRSTAWVESPQQADGRITRIDPPAVLAYAWTWRGCPTTVEIELAAAGSSTTHARLRHTWTGVIWPTASDCEAFVCDYWWGVFGNLRQYLKDGRAALQPDFTTRAKDVELSIEIDAPPERVYRALTDPALLDRWLSTAAVIEPRAGGTFLYGWTTPFEGQQAVCGPKQCLELVPGKRVVHDWHYQNEGPSQVAWEFTPLAGGRTRVTLRHTFSQPYDASRDGYVQGWSRYLLGLKDMTEESGLIVGGC